MTKNKAEQESHNAKKDSPNIKNTNSKTQASSSKNSDTKSKAKNYDSAKAEEERATNEGMKGREETEGMTGDSDAQEPEPEETSNSNDDKDAKNEDEDVSGDDLIYDEIIKNIKYPTNKIGVVNYAKIFNPSQRLLSIFENIEERIYFSSNQLSQAAEHTQQQYNVPKTDKENHEK